MCIQGMATIITCEDKNKQSRQKYLNSTENYELWYGVLFFQSAVKLMIMVTRSLLISSGTNRTMQLTKGKKFRESSFVGFL